MQAISTTSQYMVSTVGVRKEMRVGPLQSFLKVHIDQCMYKCLGCLNLRTSQDIQSTSCITATTDQSQPPPIVEVRTAYCNDMYEWVVVVSLQ